MRSVHIPKLTFWSVLFALILGAGLYSTFIRFYYGLGAASNMSDQFPWGIWVGFDVICGVGLAAGGFVLAATVYTFNLESYRPILRPAILMGFLGYTLVIVGLLFELGRPWYVWRILVYPNWTSVLCEIGWCASLYTTVLALEFSPIVFERLKMERPQKIIHAITIPLVIFGVILSTLHQSSLGSLFLIVPSKLYPLWYSSALPYLFFTSAVAVGPAILIIASYYSARTFRKEIDLRILGKLAQVSAVALSIYLILKVEDIFGMNQLPYLFIFNFEGMMYWAEILLGVVTPIILLVQPRIRASRNGLFVAAVCVVLGFVLNRMNISVTALVHYTPVSYFPTWMETSITVMKVSVGFVAARLAMKYLPIFPESPRDAQPIRVAETNDVVSFVELPSAVAN